MKKIQAFAASLLLAFLSGCGGTAAQTGEAAPPATESTTALTSASTPTAAAETTTTVEKPIEPLYTDEEAFALGDTCARSLQRLFLDYLYYDGISFLKLRTTGKSVISNIPGSDTERYFFGKESDTIKTFDDLKAVFTEFCTEDYALYLLHESSYYYMDIDGLLYSSPTEYCFRGSSNAYITGWEQRGEDEIVFTLIDIGNDLFLRIPSQYYSEDYVRDTSYDRPFTMTVVKRNGKWLISDCDQPWIIGYVYRTDTFGEYGEYGDEEARRLADEFAPKIKKAFLDYLQYDRDKLVLKPNGKTSVIEDDYRERTYSAIGVENDTIKTYEELETALSGSFSPQGLNYLFTYPYNFHKYVDIDGALYMIPSTESFQGTYENMRLIDWYRCGRSLEFVYYADGDDPDSDPNDRYITFAIADYQGEWLVDYCPRPDVFGYCYESESLS